MQSSVEERLNQNILLLAKMYNIPLGKYLNKKSFDLRDFFIDIREREKKKKK